MTSPGGEPTADSPQNPEGDIQGAYEQFVSTVTKARESGSVLNIVGGGTKSFYGRKVAGDPLETRAYRGIVEYEPAELVITARAGTSLQQVDRTLAAENQMLAFEPPCFGDNSTIGGVVAAGLSGPRRPYGGAVRDAVLGVKVMPGTAEALSFGGQVMKNVAGYDVSRLMTGAMGTLGLLLVVSIRVAPRPVSESTAVWELSEDRARERMVDLARRPWPVSGMSYDSGFLRVRLSGHPDAVREAEVALAPDSSESTIHWRGLRDQTLPFFKTSEPVWRLSVLPAADLLPLDGDWLLDWGGSVRWLKSRESTDRIRAAAKSAGGHATVFRGGREDSPFTPLDAVNLRLHRRLKQAFDPQGIFNPGRMYAEL
jgi:glycolate oxidase FAD binding subunit